MCLFQDVSKVTYKPTVRGSVTTDYCYFMYCIWLSMSHVTQIKKLLCYVMLCNTHDVQINRMLLLRINAILNVASLCFWDCMFHAVYRIFKVYLRTLDIEHRIYRRKRNLLNLPYSPMITICSLSTVITCVKRSQIRSDGHCLCNMFHFFLFFISIKFQFPQLQALTPDTVSYHVLCCHDIRIFMVLSYGM